MPAIVTCGIPRSGSTLVWQLLQAIFPDQEILKTHPNIWSPDGSVAVVSVRDPRDVVASLYRVRLSRNGATHGGPEDIANVLHRMRANFEAAREILKGPHVLLRYEEFFCDHSVIYDAIERALGVRVPVRQQRHLSESFSADANHKRASRLANFNEVGEYMIHGDHIGRVVPGSWQDALPAWALERVASECEDIAKEWGYD